MDQPSWRALFVMMGAAVVTTTACGDSSDANGDSATTTGVQTTGGATTGAATTGAAVTTASTVQGPGSGAETTGAMTTSTGPGASNGSTAGGDTTTSAGVETSSGGSSTGTEGTGTEGTSATAGGVGGTATAAGGASSSTTGAGTTMGDIEGPCTASEPTGTNASGTGPHEVVVETNGDAGINEGTIFRPADLGGGEKYPIFVWGQGGCSQNGLSNQTAMAEIASHGYFVVADGTPNGSGNRTMDRSNLEGMGAALIGYVDWAITENHKPCSAYYQALDTAMVASNGFSCGGMMAQGTVIDPRIVTWGVTSSGMAGADQAFYDEIHTPVLFVEGGPAEVAYDGGLEGYEAISDLGVPVLWFSKDIGHGGDLFEPDGGDFTKINLAWLNWWLKGDETATGKGMLIGADCPYCTDPEWVVMSANVP